MTERKPVASFTFGGLPYPYVVCDDGAVFAFDADGKWRETQHAIPGSKRDSEKTAAPSRVPESGK
jgi:hypothetical protein